MEYERLKENLQILDAHNHGQGKVINLTGGQKTESILLHEVISDCREILNKIEQGTLIELPCKYGELLFLVCSDKDSISGNVYRHIEACRVDEIMTFRSGGFVIGVREVNTGYGHNGTLGNTLFFTFEEAEKRLKELQNG